MHFLTKSDAVNLSEELSAFTEDWGFLDPEINAQTDAARTVDYCHRIGAEHAIIDHYHADEAYQHVLLDAGLRWMQFDGAASFPLWADWVVSMSPAADADRYSRLQRRPHTRMMLGPRYAILRDEFLEWQGPRPVPSQAERLLLIFGGGDDRGACVTCLDALRHTDRYDITILSGGANPQLPCIHTWMKENKKHRVRLLLDEPDVAERMSEADMAISAGGTTTFELAMMGLPALIIQIADNQWGNAQAWGRIGAMIDLGPLESLNTIQLCDQLMMLAQDQSLREQMAIAGREYVDGHGVDRLLRELYPDGNDPS